MSKTEVLNLNHLKFGFVSCFDIRISDLSRMQGVAIKISI